MKKLLGIIAAVFAAIMCFAFAGCAPDVNGTTYKFGDIKVAYGRNISKEEQERSNVYYDALRKQNERVEINFAKDGSYSEYELVYNEKDKKDDKKEKDKGYYRQLDGKLYLVKASADSKVEGEDKENLTNKEKSELKEKLLKQLEEKATKIYEINSNKIVLTERDETTGVTVKTIYNKK